MALQPGAHNSWRRRTGSGWSPLVRYHHHSITYATQTHNWKDKSERTQFPYIQVHMRNPAMFLTCLAKSCGPIRAYKSLRRQPVLPVFPHFSFASQFTTTNMSRMRRNIDNATLARRIINFKLTITFPYNSTFEIHFIIQLGHIRA